MCARLDRRCDWGVVNGERIGAVAREVGRRAAASRLWRLAVAGAVVVLAGCASLATSIEGDAQREVLLTVAQQGSTALALTGAPSSRHLRRRGYGAAPPDIDRILDQLAKEHGLRRKEGWPIRSLAVYCEVLVVPEGRDVADVVADLRADPRVELAQRMHLFDTLGGYDDPLSDLQPAAVDLGIEAAHRLATGKGVRVAVIDSAVDAAHPELEGRVALRRDLVEPRRLGPAAAELHGTAVAGIIASAANNREGIVGVAPDVTIDTLRACWPHPAHESRARCSTFTLARALEIVLGARPHVINLSLSGPSDPLLERLLDEAVTRGIVVVAAEPPAGAAANAFPAAHPAVLVARSSAGGGRGFPAPADEILTTTPGAGYAFFSGTSLAAAHLSGVVALLLERAPGMDASSIADVLNSTIVQHERTATVSACGALEALTDVRICGVGLLALTPFANPVRVDVRKRTTR